MFIIVALATVMGVAQAAVSGDYCYTDSLVCTAFAESGYTYLVTNESMLDRPTGTMPKIDMAYLAVMNTMCSESSNTTECTKCFMCDNDRTVEQISKCYKGVLSPSYNRTSDFLEKQEYLKNQTMVTIDPSRVSCYMNQKAQLVFGGLEANRTFTKPKEMSQSVFGMWMFRANMLADYVDTEVAEGNAVTACKVAGATEVFEMASIMEFMGLKRQQLKEELVCRCLMNMK